MVYSSVLSFHSRVIFLARVMTSGVQLRIVFPFMSHFLANVVGDRTTILCRVTVRIVDAGGVGYDSLEIVVFVTSNHQCLQ